MEIELPNRGYRVADLTVLSICTGIGGLDIGIELATGGAARVVCAIEREAFCAAILAARMADKSMAAFPVWSDLRTFGGEPWRGCVDIIAGGIPCQPWSVAGKRRGASDERHLWPEAARIIAEVQPGVVFIENVSGFLGGGLEAVCDDLWGLGYRTTAGLFTAEEVGAPHRRERCFVMGVAGGGVADADGKRLQGQRDIRAAARTTGRGGGAGVADAVCDGRRPHKQIGGSDRRAADNGAGGTGGRGGESAIPVFPPGPADIDAWREVIAEDPGLSPAIESDVRRMAHGSASRMDRLRALGNAVVPLQAAHAFTTLWACLWGE